MTDIESLIAQMTLEEKAALCTGATSWTTTPVERLGIPSLTVADGPHGLRRMADVTAPPAAACRPPVSRRPPAWPGTR